jgi:hypothetical protein
MKKGVVKEWKGKDRNDGRKMKIDREQMKEESKQRDEGKAKLMKREGR